MTRKDTLWGGGALQLLEHAILLDAARDDDGRGNTQPLVREVDLLGRLCAPELVDLKRVPVDTAKERGTCCECERTLTEIEHYWVVAHPRMIIFVSLRMAASAEAPLSPMRLCRRLRARYGMGTVRESACQWALTLKRALVGGCALQRGHGAPLERLAQLGNALGGVAAEAVKAEAAELVLGQAAKARRGVSMGADTKANTTGRRRT